MKNLSLRWMLLALAITFAATSSAQEPPQTQKKHKVYLVSNAHLDTQWQWDIKRTIDEYLYNTATANIALLERYPHYVFNFEGAIKYQWIKEYYPHLYGKVTEFVKSGRWHLSGASWDANDPNMPSSESFIRNILLAQEFYKQEFGIKSKDMFLPDCFGFSQVMPTLGNHCGLIGFSTQKLTWRNEPLVGESKSPFPLGLWQGVDGSRIMVALEPGRYSWNIFPEGDLSANKELIESAKKSPFGIAYRYYGNKLADGSGDKGASPMPRSIQLLEEAITSGKGPLEIVSASSSQLYEEFLPYDKHPELPVFDGEMPLDVHAPGCYTAQAEMKRYNRRNEQLAGAAERSATIADWFGAISYPKAAINDAWQRFLWHQFHDDLTGTSIAAAYTYSWNDEVLAQNQFCDVIAASSGAVASLLDTRTKGTPIVVYNSAAYANRGLVEVEVELPAQLRDVAVYGPDGKQTPSQLLVRTGNWVKVLFAASALPVGYAVYDLRPGKPAPSKSLKVSERTLENRIYKLTLDANGDIASITDKRQNRELVESGKAFRLGVIEPNVSNRYPAWEIPFATLEQPSKAVDGEVKITVAEAGNTRVALRVERKFGDSKFVQYIRLTDGGADERIDVVTEVDWKTPNALLKAEFPTSVSNKNAVYDIGIGTQTRPTNHKRAHETFAHHWADLSADGYGVAVLNDCKYGWDKPTDNTLRLTLLHTPSTEKRYADQRTLDIGRHTMTYSIVGHTGDHNAAGLTEQGEKLNQQLMAFSSEKHAGQLGRTFGFASTSTPQLAIKAIKKAEDGNGYIVRLFETTGKAVENAEVRFATNILSATEVNGIEEPLDEAQFKGNKLIVNAGHYAPKSYRITLAAPTQAAKTITSTSVALPYNQNSISTDALKALAKMDKPCNSYAAELMPRLITYRGVEYRMGEPDVNNALKCAKQTTIELPQGNYNKISILAASADGDRKATFEIDGKPYLATIPYYSGFVAQWAWGDKTKSFVREGSVAYIGNHRHQMNGRNDSYVFTYLYALEFDITPGAKTLTLPTDEHVTVFAVTAVEHPHGGVQWACEPRALPLTE